MHGASDKPGVRLAAIGQIALTVRDLDAAVTFYRDALGIAFLYRFPGLAFFDCAGVRLMLSEPEGEFEQAASVLYFRVADIQEAVAELRGRGVRFMDEPHLIARMPDHDLWMAFFRDLDDNQLALMSEVRSG